MRIKDMNKEQKREYDRIKLNNWRKNNKSKDLEQKKRWRENHKDHKTKYDKEWIKNHPNYYRAWIKDNLNYHKDWNSNHPNYSYESHKRWLKKNPTYRKEYIKRYMFNEENYRKDLIRQRDYRNLRPLLLKKISYCQLCGSKENLELHHKKYDETKDVLLLCRKCHKQLHNQNNQSNLKGGNK